MEIQQQKKQVRIIEIPDEAEAEESASPADGGLSSKTQQKPAPVAPSFRTILPLPAQRLRTEERLVKPVPRRKRSSGPPPGGCGLALCQRTPCKLLSHHHFAKTLVERRKQQDEQANKQDTHSTTNRSSTTTTTTTATTTTSTTSYPVVTDSMDMTSSSLASSLIPLALGVISCATSPALPLDGYESELSTLRKLHNDFFTQIVTYMHTLVIVPFEGRPAYITNRKQELYENSISKRVDCLNSIGAAHVFFSARSRLRPDQDSHLGMVLHTALMKSLRDLLEHYVPARDADVVVSTIFTLVIVDLNVQRGRRSPASLTAHREGMIKVVNSLGGIHNSQHGMQFIIHLDRVIATQMDIAPLYTTWESVTVPIQRASLYPTKYGTFFDSDPREADIHPEISAYCSQVCRAVEILEGEKWNYTDLRAKPLTAEIYYFYYLRNRVVGQYVWINARHVGEQTKQRCVLLAAKVVEYSVLMDNYLAAITMGVADKLLQLLQQQDISEVWEGWRDVLTWISFVLVCMPNYYDQWDAAMELCYDNLMHIYGVQRLHSLAGWEEVLLENCQKFVWSESLDSSYANACAQLRHMSMKRSQ